MMSTPMSAKRRACPRVGVRGRDVIGSVQGVDQLGIDRPEAVGVGAPYAAGVDHGWFDRASRRKMLQTCGEWARLGDQLERKGADDRFRSSRPLAEKLAECQRCCTLSWT
jgi:hypothetical protein